MGLIPRRQRFVTEYLVDLNASQAALRAGYSARTAPQQGSRLLKNVHVQAAIAAKQTQQLAAVNVRVEDVLRDLQAIAHTDLQTLSAQSGVPARWADKLKALELLMKHLGLAAPEQHQHLHQHLHFTPDQLRRMTDDQLQQAQDAYAVLAGIERGLEQAHSRRMTALARSSDTVGHSD